MGAVIVVGSIGGDLVVTVDEHPRSGETVMGSTLATFPGGKGANQAIAAAKAGAQTRIVGRIGTDAAGALQRDLFERLGIDQRGVTSMDDAPTQTAVIAVDRCGENRIVVISGASGLVTEMDVSGLAFAHDDVVVCQLEIPQGAVVAAFSSARASQATTILNLAPAAVPVSGLLDLVDILVVNETEAGFLLGSPLPDPITFGSALPIARSLIHHPGQTIVLTLGAQGALAVHADETFFVSGRTVAVTDTTGAGDCFVGFLAAALADGLSLRAGMESANAAAALCVQQLGAGSSIPERAAVESYMGATVGREA